LPHREWIVHRAEEVKMFLQEQQISVDDSPMVHEMVSYFHLSLA
jgi:hypothetical protein